MVDQVGQFLCDELLPVHLALSQSVAPTAPNPESQTGSEGSPEFSLAQSDDSKKVRYFAYAVLNLNYKAFNFLYTLVLLTQKCSQFKLDCTAPLDHQRESFSGEGTNPVNVPQLLSHPLRPMKRLISQGH